MAKSKVNLKVKKGKKSKAKLKKTNPKDVQADESEIDKPSINDLKSIVEVLSSISLNQNIDTNNNEEEEEQEETDEETQMLDIARMIKKASYTDSNFDFDVPPNTPDSELCDDEDHEESDFDDILEDKTYILLFEKDFEEGGCREVENEVCRDFWRFIDSNRSLSKLVRTFRTETVKEPTKPPKGDRGLEQDDEECCIDLMYELMNRTRIAAGQELLKRQQMKNQALMLKSGQKLPMEFRLRPKPIPKKGISKADMHSAMQEMDAFDEKLGIPIPIPNCEDIVECVSIARL